MSRDQLLYVADMVSVGDAVLRYMDGVTPSQTPTLTVTEFIDQQLPP